MAIKRYQWVLLTGIGPVPFGEPMISPSLTSVPGANGWLVMAHPFPCLAQPGPLMKGVGLSLSWRLAYRSRIGSDRVADKVLAVCCAP